MWLNKRLPESRANTNHVQHVSTTAVTEVDLKIPTNKLGKIDYVGVNTHHAKSGNSRADVVHGMAKNITIFFFWLVSRQDAPSKRFGRFSQSLRQKPRTVNRVCILGDLVSTKLHSGFKISQNPHFCTRKSNFQRMQYPELTTEQ